MCTPHEITSKTRNLKFILLTPSTVLTDQPDKYNAVHIRRGDNAKAIILNNIKDFEGYIKSSEIPVYVASDDPFLKDIFMKKYGEHVFFQLNGVDRSSAVDLRASIEELMYCVNANNFKGSVHSSFTTLIQELRRANRHE